MLTFILFIIGFIFLIKGADLLVEGASAISKKFGVSSLVIGLTVVSFGTSAPELVVNILSGIKGASDIGIGNVLGSNVANILLILGVSAAISEINIKKGLMSREVPFSLLAILIIAFMANDSFFGGRGFNEIDRIDGLVLLCFFAIFMYYMASNKQHELFADKPDVKKLPMPLAVFYVVIGTLGLTIGGKWIVDGGIAMAQILNISENLVGLTIVAVGTSLPELATSVVAALKDESDIAIGNVVGSNIFNLFFILGVSATINPIGFNPAVNNIDIFMVGIATVLLYMAISVDKKSVMQKWNGYSFLIMYAGYIGFLVWRG
jgi:cation:H+ antiporter